MRVSRDKIIPKHSIHSCVHVNGFEYAPYFLFPLKQGCREEAKPVANIGQVVETGSLLAIGEGANSQNVHSSVGGTLVGKKRIRFPGDLADINVLEIKFGGRLKSFPLHEEIDMTKTMVKTILSRIARAGIYDLDIGALEHDLFSKVQSGYITHIFVNAVEIGPYMLLEEMILRKHIPKIIAALKVLINICNMSGKVSFPHTVCYSNSFSTRHKFVSQMRKASDLNNIPIGAYSLPAKISADEIPISNYSWFIQQLSEDKGAEKNNVVMDKSLVLRPSTLLSLYELLFSKKPVVDKYIQIITGINSSFITRIPMGMSILYALLNCNGLTKDMQHYFYGDILKRNAIVNFAIPISKQASHYFMLSDDEFSHMYKKLKRWM